MLNGAKLTEEMRQSLWAECANTSTDLNNILVTEGNEKCPYEKLYGTLPKFTANLKTFGEVVIIKKSELQGIKPKLDNRGIVGIFVGYSHNHGEGVYRFYCPENKSVRLSRDVKWMGKSYEAYKKDNEGENIGSPNYVIIEEINDEKIADNKKDDDEQINEEKPSEDNTTEKIQKGR